MILKKMLVYLQAVPLSIPSKAKNFGDLSSSNLRMSHSSKVALDRAVRVSRESVAVGHSSILPEAIARGAKEAKPLPLCDDPLAQAESMGNLLTESDLVSVLIGESLDGPFSGAALCGALSSVYNLNISYDSEWKGESSGSVVLLRDTGSGAYNIDIRKINYASSKEFPDSAFVGNSALEKNQPRQPIELTKEVAAKEIASTISRKLSRLSSAK